MPGRRATAVRPLAKRRAPLRTLLVCLAFACRALAVAQAQGAPATVTIGVAGQVVAGAWNPVRVVARDLPPSTFSLQLDAGNLKDGEVPISASFELRGGRGVNVFETDLFVPPFRSLAWRVSTADRVVTSGSLGSRQSDERPLVLLLAEHGASTSPANAAAAWPGTRPTDVAPSDLPVTPAAYDGVAAVRVDHRAPPVDALVAAAVAGAEVMFVGDAPPSLAPLLADGGSARLGAGLLASGGPDSRVAAGFGLTQVRPGALLAAALSVPLVSAPRPAPVSGVLIAAVAYAALALVLLRFAGAQGLLSAGLLAVIAGLGAWAVLRPSAARYEGALAVGVVGGALAGLHEGNETLSLPAGVLRFTPGASVLPPRAYLADDAGVSLPVRAWRSAVVILPPRAVSAPLALDGVRLSNLSASRLEGVYVVGLGAQQDVAPGASSELGEGELGAYPAAMTGVYSALLPLLPQGTLVATSGCDAGGQCVVWLADTSLSAAAARAERLP